MTSFGVEAVMEEQYSEGSKMLSSCATLQLGDGSPSNELNNDQKPMEQGSLESPSTIKRWEIGPLLQSFKSKMASFTEIVMSPVRLFKPSDSLASTRFSDQQEHSTTESNEESSTRTEEGETTGDKCKNRLFSKRPSSERVQCNAAPKRHRVAQRLNFGTISGSNNKPDLYHIKLHNDVKVAPNEENQIHRPSIHSQAVHHDGINDSSPWKAESPFLRTRPIPSDQPLNEASAKCMSTQANVQTDETVAQQRLTGERQTQSSEVDDSITACGHSSDSYFSEEVSNHLKPETKSVFANSTKTTSLNNGSEASSSIYSVFHLIGEDTRRRSVFYSEQSNSQMAIRRSPRKSVKRLSKIAEPTYTELATFVTGPKTLDNDMKELQSENVIEWTGHSVKISDRLKGTSVVEVRAKRCREVPRREAKKVLLAREKCNLQNTEEEDLRPAKNKKGKDNITLKKHQEDAIIVQIRKKREGISTVQQLSNTVDVHMINSVVSETSESCDSTEIKQIRPDKTVKSKRKNVKCGLLLTSGNEADTTDTTSFQNPTTNVSIDKSLGCNNLNAMYDCNYGDSRSSEPSVLQHPMQAQETFEKSVESRKTRQHFLKSARGSTFQKRNLRPPKQKFEDYSTTSVVDPAGPSKPAKRTLLQNNLFFDETQRTIIATEEQESFLSPGVLMSPPMQPDSTALLLPERRLRRPTKILNRQSKKHVFAGKRKGFIASEDQAETQEKTVEAIPVVSSSGSGSNRLLRSYSCPEIPSLLFSDSCLTLSHTHDNSTTSPPKSSPIPLSTHFHSPSKRTRRHTVCSVEIEREIAPLCLRKEVYPATRGGHHSGPFSPYSPSISLTTLASCFLSSPLAFLSKSSSQWRSHASDTSTGSAHAVASPFTSNFVKSSSPSSFSSPCTSTLTACHALTGPSTVVTPRPETPPASVSSLCSAFTQSSLDGDNGMLQMECEEAMDEQKRSNFGLQLSSTAISEEKALSDSEIKTEIKEGHLGKVSSIRIRKKIPKPQNNLTPMGLPKVIRIKKKDFSLEEIYTNKNFSKPPDGRLETIFEEPLNRRDGSQAIVGQRKVKRFVEFPELGVARKPKKPLVGGTAGGGAQRKAGGNHGFCRTRRGVGASSKVEDGLTLQELDSLLCSKLEELDTWTALQQVAC